MGNGNIGTEPDVADLNARLLAIKAERPLSPHGEEAVKRIKQKLLNLGVGKKKIH